MIEWIGLVAMALGIGGVVLNNYRRRVCFLVWMVSNLLSCLIHLSPGHYTPSLALRDAAFFLLAIHGWHRWGRK